MSAIAFNRGFAPQALGKRLLEFLFHAPVRHHWRRYILGAVVSVIGIWSMAVGYYVFTPPTYTSSWSLILPGSGAGTSVSLDSIGQTSTQSSGYSPALSPKVIYKEIATSDRVIAAAAASLNMSRREFGAPRVKLIDETALMLFEIAARTPEAAKAKAEALTDAFMKQLDALRQDEIERRAASVSDTLRNYRDTLQQARQRIYDTQQKSGIVSVEQFNQIATSLETTRGKARDARAEAERLDAEQTALSDRLGVDARTASAALILAADPVFAKALSEYADADSAVSSQAQWIGPNNPVAVKERMRRDAAWQTLTKTARAAGVDADQHLPKLVLILNSKSREELLKQLVTGEAQIDGKRRELAALEQTLADEEARLKELNGQAARLEDLKKDHLVAEAVFTSAVARLDTNRADIFASYPLVQMLANPDLPMSKSQPLLIYAIAGGVAGTIFASAAWTLAWMRQLFARKRRKNA